MTTRTPSPRAVLVAAVLLAFPVQVQAQTPARTAGPTHSVVRFFKCNPQGAGVRLFQQMRPVVRQMIAEGKFVDYGLMTHAWGDDWNVVDYFVVSDLGAFFANFAELVRRVSAALPPATNPPQAFNEVCTAHKDVIYNIVPPTADSLR